MKGVIAFQARGRERNRKHEPREEIKQKMWDDGTSTFINVQFHHFQGLALFKAFTMAKHNFSLLRNAA